VQPCFDNWGRGLAYFAFGAAIGAAGSYVGGLAAYATLATVTRPKKSLQINIKF